MRTGALIPLNRHFRFSHQALQTLCTCHTLVRSNVEATKEASPVKSCRLFVQATLSTSLFQYHPLYKPSRCAYAVGSHQI